MLNPPAMLGLVLPQSFLSSPLYQDANREIARQYCDISIVELPKLFRYADNETIALMASGRKEDGKQLSIRYGEVLPGKTDEFFQDFHISGQRSEKVTPPSTGEAFTLWIQRPDAIWDRLKEFNTLGAISDIRRGLQWIPRSDGKSKRDPRADVASNIEKPGYRIGVEKMRGNLTQFRIKTFRYLSLLKEHQDANTSAHTHPWAESKVVCNAARFDRKSPWRLSAWADADGHAFSQHFFAVWPIEELSVFSIAAILCSPIANAFSFVHDLERHNHISTLRRLPVPHVSLLQRGGTLDERCRQLQTMLQADQPNPDRIMEDLIRLDAAVLDAYELPGRVQRQLLDQFQGWRRPLAVPFEGYFPHHFKDVISLRDLITIKYDWEAANDRRCDLIDKDISGCLTTHERTELDHLQL
ncbi:MAG: hypothetical protein KDA66_19880, partial [Planctomycetaceae bacterium]|nr:hypothetical protein [Planctomycetaceae bacterium]